MKSYITSSMKSKTLQPGNASGDRDILEIWITVEGKSNTKISLQNSFGKSTCLSIKNC